MVSSWLLVQMVVTGALAGLCWTVQLAVYPQFARLLRAAGAEGFRGYHAAYTRAMGWVAGPLMLAELALAAGWVWSAGGAAAWAGLGLVVVIWIQTFGQLVPWHARLQRATEETTARALARWNLLRTLLWTLRAAGLAVVATGAVSG
ncbi:MAG: hypothetical protein MUE42_06210 [Opitutaceae bacterium]|jgi:hypothetical protein|nr:hypothetical protein [Opitutaceae bacterium]